MKYRRYAYVFSSLIILAGVDLRRATGGFRLGVDFAGGRLIEYRFDQTIDGGSCSARRWRTGASRGAEIQESERGTTS